MSVARSHEPSSGARDFVLRALNCLHPSFPLPLWVFLTLAF